MAAPDAPRLPRRTAALKAKLDAFPGSVGAPYFAPSATTPLVFIYKVMGKQFAILGAREEAFVILKTEHADMLRERYTGIGHRSHLDRRFWISVDLDADVTPAEVLKLARSSYDIVCAGLTRKRQAELARLAGG